LCAVGAGIFSAVTGVQQFFHSAGFVIARNVALLLAVVFWLALGFSGCTRTRAGGSAISSSGSSRR
jgi:hypothetical protein